MVLRTRSSDRARAFIALALCSGQMCACASTITRHSVRSPDKHAEILVGDWYSGLTAIDGRLSVSIRDQRGLTPLYRGKGDWSTRRAEVFWTSGSERALVLVCSRYSPAVALQVDAITGSAEETTDRELVRREWTRRYEPPPTDCEGAREVLSWVCCEQR
ncbi:MAG: hypothetical protein U0Q16_06575 [Bryobacteraceae bacterium]